MEIIRCLKIGLLKKAQQLLHNLSFTVDQGQFFGITGPSGAGKSSLLQVINLLQSPTYGTVWYKNKVTTQYDPLQLRREMGYVLQKPYLFPGTIRDNLEYPYLLWKQKTNPQEIQQYLEKVNLTTHLLDKRVTELSGGEQQRITLVRSLLAKPEVLLLDEISASLDEKNTLIIEQLLQLERAERHITVLFISHNTDQINRLADKLIHLDKGQLDFSGTVPEFFRWEGSGENE